MLGRSGADRLATLPVAHLVRTIAGLAADSDVFDNLMERATLRTDLAALGLEPLLDRAVRAARAARTRSATSSNSRGGSPPSSTCSAPTAPCSAPTPRSSTGWSATSGSSTKRMPRHPVRCSRPSSPRSGGSASSTTRPRRQPSRARCATATRMPQVSWRWRPPCCARSRRSGSRRPTTCRSIPDSREFDVVVIADAAALCLAEAAPALRRARQVVVFGDPVTQKPTPFRIAAGVRRRPSDDADEPFDETSVFERLAELLPVETLTRSYRAGGEDLARSSTTRSTAASSCRCRGPARTSAAAASASTTSRAVRARLIRSPVRSRARMPRSRAS